MGAKSHSFYRKSINMDSEIAQLRVLFQSVSDTRANNASHKLDDILMCGYALFSLKHPSLLDFMEQSKAERFNLKNVYGIDSICSATQLRDVLDKIDPCFLRDYLATKFKTLQNTGLLKSYGYKIGSGLYHIISCDGVQHFSSKTVSCPCCLEKKHKNGSITYHHNMLSAVLVHPEKREVFLMDSEPIIQQDGETKNDCELNASKRLHNNLTTAYSSYQRRCNFLIVEDALYANGPHIKLLQTKGFDFILNAKPKSHKTLFKYIEGKRKRGELKKLYLEENGILHRFEYLNNVTLSNSHPTLKVNFIHYTQTNQKGETKVFSWITSIKILPNRLMALMRAGRSRWKIENETFNTLKNLGYFPIAIGIEHNFGHGKDHLCTLFAFLMFTAFYIDQLIQATCHIFNKIEQNFNTKIKIWQTFKAIFKTNYIASFKELYKQVAVLFNIRINFNSS